MISGACPTCELLWLDPIRTQQGLWKGSLSQSNDEGRHKEHPDPSHYIHNSEYGRFAVDPKVITLSPGVRPETRPQVILTPAPDGKLRAHLV